MQGHQHQLSAYELERQQRIADNKAKMMEIGVAEARDQLLAVSEQADATSSCSGSSNGSSRSSSNGSSRSSGRSGNKCCGISMLAVQRCIKCIVAWRLSLSEVYPVELG